MKMIASTKMVRAQKAMEVGKIFGSLTRGRNFWNFISISIESFKKNFINTSEGDDQRSKFIICCSSDRGLCGAIHSSLAKLTKQQIRNDESKNKMTVEAVILGDKAKAQIAKDFRKKIKITFNQIGKSIPSFDDAIQISIFLEQNIDDFLQTTLTIFYNEFKSVIAYNPGPLSHIVSLTSMRHSDVFSKYETENYVIEAFVSFNRISGIFQGLVEGHASEMAAKRMAMENASKNAESICSNLIMQYNRTRQAVITNELVDIITGASAL